MVAFSRAVLRYWTTLDPSGLEPFLSANTLAAVRAEGVWAAGPHAALLALRRQLDGETLSPAEPAEQVEAFLDRLATLSPATLAGELARVAPSTPTRRHRERR